MRSTDQQLNATVYGKLYFFCPKSTQKNPKRKRSKNRIHTMDLAWKNQLAYDKLIYYEASSKVIGSFWIWRQFQ